MSGDSKVAGMFMGAGRGSSVIDDPALRKEFEDKVVAIEQVYIHDREELARLTYEKMDELFRWVLSKAGTNNSKVKKPIY